MILPGHIAAAYLAAKAASVDLRGALAAAMCPDLIDKPIRWLLRLTPNDRIPAHSLLGGVVMTAAAYRLAGGGFARGWAAGYAAHLLCDEINAHLNPGRIYFWWPFKRYTFHRGPTGLNSSLRDFSRASVVIEGLLTLAGLAVWARGGRHRKPNGGLSHASG